MCSRKHAAQNYKQKMYTKNGKNVHKNFFKKLQKVYKKCTESSECADPQRHYCLRSRNTFNANAIKQGK